MNLSILCKSVISLTYILLFTLIFSSNGYITCSSVNVIHFHLLSSVIFRQENPSEKDINQGTLVVFNLDSSVTNDDLHQIFCVYGEIKEVIISTLMLSFTKNTKVVYMFIPTKAFTYTCTSL